MRTGGQILVDQLKRNGVERLTCVPGESYLAALDAMYDADIDVLICRHEGGAAMMAEAYGKLTGRPGICFVTRGPGATNAAHGVHIAQHDSTPMILFVGQVERAFLGRGAFQELDYVAAFGGIAKWVVEISDPKRIPEIVARAFRVAMQGRPGPVVVSLPEDILTEVVEVADAPPVAAVAAAPTRADMAAFVQAVEAAERPMMILGGSRWTAEGCIAVAEFAARYDIPVATEFRRTSLFAAHHPCYAGDLGFGQNPALSQRVKDADLLILLGARMAEVPSNGYTLIGQQTLVHVFPEAEEIGRVYQPALGIVSTPDQFAKTLSGISEAPPVQIIRGAAAHQDWLKWTTTPSPIPGDFQYGEVMVWLREHLPPETIITNGAGNYAIWVHRYWRHERPFTQVAPTSGSVGYSVPAGIMAKRQCPDAPVVTFAGDGCFLMNGNEFATAVQYGIPLIIIVIDNGMWGTIRMHQEREYPHRPIGTELKNPDFAAYAKAFGGHGETVHTTADFAPAFERARASGKPAILHCLIDPQAITPAKTLDQVSRGE
ncbi:thiamine pyrophosphate-binding protein [Asticcacaulis excentricus]|uniref:Thiamine pyrophosphate TPP-binding domain-containing protein n=1 Tax=Asticcacaulis excentricus (strain ATCC 15261 / DSM 4724 / KCTC 12464 / NCIMB 9791 / VKM B-1370 / CB 48) TaxID=573065 RepID=E8RLG4_ASTEC|nr:thiamine pyrophosphate-binding protein [Asticcacaulis excentricus]ADU13708.1 thiamine pyrophosphate TPP-binding domain-containing protein [Asticcacaulis excentricus CB 48]